MKIIQKKNLINYNQIYSILNEPNFLKRLINYDFVPKIICSFQDFENIYLVTNFLEGKSVEEYKDSIMSEEQIKFISACVIQSLIYLRKEKLIHRDIVMKNIIMDKDKYFNIIDFSYSIDYDKKNDSKKNIILNKDQSPPEILNNLEYDYNSDYYRLGYAIYYLLFKRYPVKNQTNISELMLEDILIKNKYSLYCIDFLNKLMVYDYKKRIGFNSITELLNHPWFKGFNWKNFEKKKMKSPFNFDILEPKALKCNNFNYRFYFFSLKIKTLYKNISKSDDFKILIQNYNYINKKIIKIN